jgi:hypothetical protein
MVMNKNCVCLIILVQLVGPSPLLLEGCWLYSAFISHVVIFSVMPIMESTKSNRNTEHKSNWTPRRWTPQQEDAFPMSLIILYPKPAVIWHLNATIPLANTWRSSCPKLPHPQLNQLTLTPRVRLKQHNSMTNPPAKGHVPTVLLVSV